MELVNIQTQPITVGFRIGKKLVEKEANVLILFLGNSGKMTAIYPSVIIPVFKYWSI